MKKLGEAIQNKDDLPYLIFLKNLFYTLISTILQWGVCLLKKWRECIYNIGTPQFNAASLNYRDQRFATDETSVFGQHHAGFYQNLK